MYLDRNIKDAITMAVEKVAGNGFVPAVIKEIEATLREDAAFSLVGVRELVKELGVPVGSIINSQSLLAAVKKLKRPEAASSTHRMSKRFARVGRALGFANATIVSDETIIAKIDEWQRRAIDAERKVESLNFYAENPSFLKRVAKAAGISQPESARPSDVVSRVEYLSTTAAAVNDVNRLAGQVEKEARESHEKNRLANKDLLTRVARAAGISQPHTALETEVIGRVEFLAARNTKYQEETERVANLARELSSRKTVCVSIPGVARDLLPHALSERIDKLEAAVAELFAMHGRIPGAGARR